MTMEKNLRQVPSVKEYTGNKKYSDLLYGYLQSISKIDEDGIRYINKADINYVAIAAELGISRQTVSVKFKNLIEEKLVFYDSSKKRYELMKLGREVATLLPNQTVRVLCNTLKERAISVLAYLIKWYYAHGETAPCDINIDLIKDYLGLNVANRSNNQIIIDTFIILERLGFIEYHIEKLKDDDTGGLRTHYIMDKINNKVELF